jgi:hypothetical protein
MPIATFPPDAWNAACTYFENAEAHHQFALHAAHSPGNYHTASTAVSIVLLVVLIGAYLLIHDLRYQNCLVQPSVFAWPHQCI